MPIRPIRLFPDPVLSKICSDVTHFDSSLSALTDDLKATMYHSPGVGLAAPQIGVSKRVSVIDVTRFPLRKGSTGLGFIILINPTVVSSSGNQVPREGCLSVPDLLANVRRFNEVVIETRTLDGGTTTFNAKGFEALAFQHEIDHLNGKLFLDRVSNLKTDVFRRKAG